MKAPAVGSIIRGLCDRDLSIVDRRALSASSSRRWSRGSRRTVRPRPCALPAAIEPEPLRYLRTRAGATTLTQPVRELVREIAPRVPIVEIGSLDDLNERSYGRQLWLARAAAFLGVIGLLLATAGLYGVSSYVVAMRSREMAIRMAVGARPHTILAMVLGQSMRVAAIGLLFGGAAAVAISWVIQSDAGIRGIDGVAEARSRSSSWPCCWRAPFPRFARRGAIPSEPERRLSQSLDRSRRST
jgi:hypothetical protein